MRDDEIRIGLTGSPVLSALAGSMALAAAMGIGRFAFTPILPMMLHDIGLSIAQGGMLASANYFGYLLGALSAIALRVRAGTAIRAGLCVIAVTTLLMGLHLPFAGWLALRLLAGMASAWVLISISAWSLQRFTAQQRPLLNNLVFAGVGFGIAAAGLLCIVLLGHNAGSAQAWMTLGAVAAIVTALVWRTYGNQEPAAAVQRPDSDDAYQWDAESIRLVICYGIFGFGYIIPATFLPVMAQQAMHNPVLFGWAWPVFGLAAAISTLAVARLNRHLDSRRLWIASHLILALGVIWPVMWPHPAAVFLAALLAGGTFMVITLSAMREAQRVAGSDPTVLIAAMTASFAVGQIAGPLAVTWGLGGQEDFSGALLAAAALLALSAAALSRKPPAARPGTG